MSGAAVETGVRGFSFMPENKVEVLNLQYVESAELERTWKINRRQRLKQQEQKIWEEFLKEQDVLNSVSQDDPYQFLDQLPHSCLKELMEVELEKMKEQEAVDNQTEEKKQEGGGGDSPDRSQQDRPEEQPTVTFAELADAREDDSDTFHIFDDDKEDDRDDEQSGPEEEALNTSTSLCTVREKPNEKCLSPVSPPQSPCNRSSKSPENVSTMIESSIYCAKIRDLRPKITNEILAVIESLEQRNILNIDPEELVKMRRRAAEFCARFNRIYLYQLHRQIHDIKRNTGAALPFARHTQFQAQAARAAALHQLLLQAAQVFHKSLEQTACADECGALLRSLVQLCAAATACGRAVPAPPRLAAAAGLYDDSMTVAGMKLDEAVNAYAARMKNYIDSTNNTSSSRSLQTSKTNSKKRSLGTWSKTSSKTKSEAGSHLSMYSLDTLRTTRPRPAAGRHGAPAKVGAAAAVPADDKQPPAKGIKKSPRRGRPLMRAPGAGRGRGGRGGRGRAPAPRDQDIRTLVEAVGTCASSHMSCEVSPRQSPKAKSSIPPRSRNVTPRVISKEATPTILSPQNPRAKLTGISPRKLPSPKFKIPSLNTKIPTLETIKPAEPLRTADSSQGLIEPVSQAGSAEKQQKNVALSPMHTYVESPKVSPRMPPPSPRAADDGGEVVDRDRIRTLNLGPARCEVTRIVRQLCGGDAAGGRADRVTGAKNAQLHCVTGGSPRQPSTPQLLKILEETIQKKVPKSLYKKSGVLGDVQRFRLALSVPARAAARLLQYRAQFVQHMLASAMYANCSVGRPWELIGSISEQLIEDLLVQCAKEMQLHSVVQELYNAETR